MRIIFHIGPHKTGTTALQDYLCKRFGSEAPVGPVWYPWPKPPGPGHAWTAWQLHRHANPEPLLRVVESARAAAVERLLLSAEDFSKLEPDRLRLCADAFAGEEVLLVATLSAPMRRAASIWQELVKQGHSQPLDDSLDRILTATVYRPDLVSAQAAVLQPAAIALVYTSPGNPAERLILDAIEAMGLPPHDDSAPVPIRANPSLGLVEAELLRQFNRLFHLHIAADEDEYCRLRDCLLATFLSADWQRGGNAVPIALPPHFLPALARRTRAILADLDNARERWPVRVYGDPADMLRGLSPEDEGAAGSDA